MIASIYRFRIMSGLTKGAEQHVDVFAQRSVQREASVAHGFHPAGQLAEHLVHARDNSRR
jgi:hypothetical protein